MKRLLYETHVHTPLCGHAEGMPGEYAAVAEKRGLRGVIVTCHGPMPACWAHQGRIGRDRLGEYLALISEAAAEWRGRVEIRPGLESDWFPGMEEWVSRLHEKADFDYILGSVHCGMPDYRRLFAGLDSFAFQRKYFEHLAEAAETGLFDCLAHPDIVKNIHDPGNWQVKRLLPVFRDCLDRVAAAGTALELNTHLGNRAVKEWCPGPELLALALERGIPVVPGSDAHSPDDTGRDFPAALRLLRDIGFDSVSFFRARQRCDVPLGDALASLSFAGRGSTPADSTAGA